MVLFYCTFVALKARNMLTIQIHPNEYKLQREKRLFQAYVGPVLVELQPRPRLTLGCVDKSSMTATSTPSSFSRTCRLVEYVSTRLYGKAS